MQVIVVRVLYEDNQVLNTTAPIQEQPASLVALSSSGSPREFSPPSAHPIAIDYLAIVFETYLAHLFPSQGMMLLDPQGHLLQSTAKARQLCKSLQNTSDTTSDKQSLQLLQETFPKEIEKLACCLIESRQLFPGQPVQLQDGIFRSDKTRIQVQAEWITLDTHQPPYIRVMLEDLTEVAQQRALLDTVRYQFTRRESEVWERYLQGFSYRQIGKALFISLNTVKRHMKSIHRKREFLNEGFNN